MRYVQLWKGSGYRKTFNFSLDECENNIHSSEDEINIIIGLYNLYVVDEKRTQKN